MPGGLTFAAPTSRQIDDGLDWNGYIKPPSIPPDPIGDDWRGPPGPQGPPGQNADFQDAPSDGTLYGRLSATWARGLPLTGGTLSGNLHLPNGTLAAPSLAFGAVDGTGLNRSANVISIGVQGTLAGSFFANAVQFNQTMFMLNNRIQQVADPTAAADALNLRTGDARYMAAAAGPYAPLASPVFTGVPIVPTAAPGTNTGQAASAAFVSAAVAGATAGVASFNSRVGIVTLSSLDVTNALTFTPYNATNPSGFQTAAQVTTALVPYAPLASPALSGTPTATTAAATAAAGTTQIATTAFVRNGTTTNDNALTGQVGEHLSATLASGSAITLTTGAFANVVTLALTAGDWDVEGQITFTNGTSTMTVAFASASNTSAALSTLPTGTNQVGPLLGATGFSSMLLPTGATRFSLASGATAYLVALATFATAPCTAYGTIRARRMR